MLDEGMDEVNVSEWMYGVIVMTFTSSMHSSSTLGSSQSLHTSTRSYSLHSCPHRATSPHHNPSIHLLAHISHPPHPCPHRDEVRALDKGMDEVNVRC